MVIQQQPLTLILWELYCSVETMDAICDILLENIKMS